MTIQKVYLTIDDSPSIHMDKKVSFLKKHDIPAIFYARGEHIAKYPQQIINAIENGFLIGNHSFSHPFFSEISIKKCKEEILKTEKLIDDCYTKANVTRSKKIIRLPFGDRGAGHSMKEATSTEEKAKVQEIQDFLKESGFEALSFNQKTSFIDAPWDWDTKDYKKIHVDDEALYSQKLRDFYTECQNDTVILLLHDFDHNHHLFEISMSFLLEHNIQFLSPL